MTTSNVEIDTSLDSEAISCVAIEYLFLFHESGKLKIIID